MFGSKQSKNQRLAQAMHVIQQKGQVKRGRLARLLGKSRGLIERDLADLADRGVMLCEDDHGRISLYEPDEKDLS
jgi:DeoR/GlpR family transcriptional regulator of sugar metabolism